MRAKACTRCRQWKVRCDVGENNRERCTRCLNLDSPCVFDGKFKRVPRDRALAALQAEVQRLTRLREMEADGHSASEVPSQRGRKKASMISPAASRDSASNGVSQNQDRTASISNYEPSTVNGQLRLPLIPPGFTPCVEAKRIGDFVFTAAQVNELFRVYFRRCHPHLPFSIANSVEEIYGRSTLLFWAICAVSSDTKSAGQLIPYIQWLIPEVLRPPHNIEMVQGLLLICTWPFPFSTQSTDPSSLYAALAVQIAYTIGLHRPTLADEFSFSSNASGEDVAARSTTWMACCIVNQIQATRRGIPSSITADYTFLSLVEDPATPSTLATLCQISILLNQASTAIGSSAPNPTGLLDPHARVHMVKLFAQQFTTLERKHQPSTHEITDMAFLSARLQLWSFILLEDVPITPDMLALLFQAEEDATSLIRIACEINLSLVPYHVCRAVIGAAVILIRILKSPFMTHHELLRDQIQRVRLALSSASRSEGDVIMNVCTMLQESPRLESKKSSYPIRSRMSFSLVCDFIRTFVEHLNANPNTQQQQHQTSPQPKGTPPVNGEDEMAVVGPGGICHLDLETFDNIDLDGLSWDEFTI